MMGGPYGMAPIGAGLLALAMTFAVIAAWIIIIIAAWRLMRAHEDIAESMHTIADSMRARAYGPAPRENEIRGE